VNVETGPWYCWQAESKRRQRKERRNRFIVYPAMVYWSLVIIF
jgi:hypothetical protein